MSRRGVIRGLFSLYLWLFVFYNLYPFVQLETYYPEERMAPRPFVKKVYFYFGVKEKDERLLKWARKKGVDLVFGFFEEDDPPFLRIKEVPPCHFIFLSDVGLFERLFNFFLEFLPYYLAGERLFSFHHHLPTSAKRCNLLLFDDFSLRGLLAEFTLDASRNFTYKRYKEGLRLERSVLHNGSKKVEIYAYSPMSFYFPGEKTVNPFKVFVRSNEKNSLILVYRNGRLFRAYEGGSVSFKVKKGGKYAVKVYTYKLKFWNYYLGLRLVAASPPVELRIK